MAGIKGKSGGRRPGAGRKKGVPNKITGDIKAMVLGALDAKGGQAYLERQADENPVAFMGLLGKILPTQITGDKENPVVVQQIIRRIVDSGEQG
ncbi:MAG: hypothetical protein RBS34_00370 [Desulfofustis sp.]|nr:hypothetical protein [Desulfofustis sp.]